MKNRDKLRSRALYDLMMTIARCRYKRCPIEIVGERKPECVPAPEGLAQTDCGRCNQEWLNEEVNTTITMDEAARKAADEIKVGDEVKDCEAEIGIVFDRKDNKYLVVYFDLAESDIYSGESERGELKKTGRHFPQVEELLAALGGDDNGKTNR